MPRVQIPITQIVKEGTVPPAQVNADAANDHYVAGLDSRTFIEVVSSDAAPQTVTVVTPGAPGGLAIADLVVTVPAGATRYIGPLSPELFDQGDNTANIDVAVSTTLKFRGYRI